MYAIRSYYVNGQALTVKGPKGALSWDIHPTVEVVQDGGELNFRPYEGVKDGWKFAGTTRALVNNRITSYNVCYTKLLRIGIKVWIFKGEILGREVETESGAQKAAAK